MLSKFPIMLTLVLAFAIPTVHAQTATKKPVSYVTPGLDCEWLSKEYDRIVARSKAGEQEVSLFGAKLTAWPFFLMTGKFTTDISGILPPPPDIGGKVLFSGNLKDVAAAAKGKNCYELFDRFRQDSEKGAIPPPTPARSNIGTKR